MSKPGRNDPCPCGSGKKYKHCCSVKVDNIIPFPGMEPPYQESFSNLTFMEQVGKSNSATIAINEMKQSIGDRIFESEEELQEFTASFYSARNSRPLPEFLGLSPEQMYQLTHGTFMENEEIVSFHPERCSIEELSEIPYIKMALHIMHFINNKGKLKATSKLGCFPRILVNNFYHSVAAEYYDFSFKPTNEGDLSSLERIRHLLTMSGMIRKLHGSFLLTKKGEKILQDNNLSLLFKELFLTYTDKFHWLYGTRYEEVLVYIQHSCIFNLFILRSKAVDFSSYEQLAQYYVNAFPMLLDELPQQPYTTPEKEIAYCFNTCFLDRLAFLFGLVDRQKVDTDKFFSETRYRLLPLFGKIFSWKVD